MNHEVVLDVTELKCHWNMDLFLIGNSPNMTVTFLWTLCNINKFRVLVYTKHYVVVFFYLYNSFQKTQFGNRKITFFAMHY